MARAAVILLCAAAAAQDLSEADNKIIQWAKDNYGVEIVTSGTEWPMKRSNCIINGKDAPAKSISAYLPLLKSELAKYPKSLLEKAGTKKMVLAVKLAVGKQERSAVPDWDEMILFLDVENGKEVATYHRRVFHHEFYHIIDYADDRKVYEDKDWTKLNPKDFKYGKGGASMYETGEDVFSKSEKIPGFLNKYGTAGVEEDKAELFSFLFTDHAFLKKRCEKDESVRSKVSRMKELMESFCPDMDEKFWEKLNKPKKSF